jgi:phosphoglycolate phosphatase-like HAD superfamily hydrolase
LLGARERDQQGWESIATQSIPDCVIFDWNGTLLADTKASWKTHNSLLAAFGGQQADIATYRKTLATPIVDFYVRHGCERGSIESGLAWCHQAFKSVYEQEVATARTRRGVRKMLAWLGALGVQRVILSNATAGGINRQLTRLRLASEIDVLLASTEFGGGLVRPSSKEETLASFLRTAEATRRIVLVGDSPQDVELGLRAGLWTIAVSGGEYSTDRLRWARPHFLVHSIHCAMGALRTIGIGGKQPLD